VKLAGSGITKPISVMTSNVVPEAPLKTADIALPGKFVPAGVQNDAAGSGKLASAEGRSRQNEEELG
jgi:hypothetical protein